MALGALCHDCVCVFLGRCVHHHFHIQAMWIWIFEGQL